MATRPNLRDVARAAGVSTATASRALNPERHVRSDLRQRVKAAAKRLRYVPNIAGRSLASGIGTTVAVVLGEGLMSDAVAQILIGMERELSTNGCGLLYAFAHSNHPLAIDRVLRQGARAVVCLDAPEAVSLAGATHLPVVCINSGWSDSRTDSSSGSPPDVAALAMAYLRSLGHERLAMIVSAGFADAILSQGGFAATSEVSLVQVPPNDGGAGARAMESLLQGQPQPTAVFCSDDALAAGALSACYRFGLRVPEDMGLLGCGDSPLARVTFPALSSVRVPWSAMGEAAVRRVLAPLNGREATNTKERGGLKIIVRASTKRLVSRETNVPRETVT